MTELGMVMSAKPLQPENALLPMVVNELGRATLVNALHSLNADWPIVVTEPGMDNFFRFEPPVKA